MKKFLLSAMVGLTFASSAWAQSCNPIEMTPEQIEKTDAIFIGKVVTKDYDPAKIVNRPAGYRSFVVPTAPEMDEEKKLKASYLLVTGAWKGVKEEQVVKIWTEAAFSEEYELDNEYLIGGIKYVKPVPKPVEGAAPTKVAPTPAPPLKKGETPKPEIAEFEVPLCGLSFHYPSYEQKKKHYNFFGEDQLTAIKDYFSKREAVDE